MKQRLTIDEQNRLRELMDRPNGDRDLGLKYSLAPGTLLRAAAGLRVSRSTFTLVRQGLASEPAKGAP